MLSFKQYLYEVARDVERASKLGSYMADRVLRKQAANSTIGRLMPSLYKTASSFIEHPEIPLKHYKADHHGAYEKYAKMHDKFIGRQETDKRIFHGDTPVPVEHHEHFDISKLKPLQPSVAFTSDHFKRIKMKDNDPINVIRHKGQHYIVDGHHRWFRDRLLGKKTISARVINGDDYA